MSDIKVKITDREGVVHELDAPTDMGMNIMELCKAYELPVEGTCGGMAMCASCQCYVNSDHELPEVPFLRGDQCATHSVLQALSKVIAHPQRS